MLGQRQRDPASRRRPQELHEALGRLRSLERTHRVWSPEQSLSRAATACHRGLELAAAHADMRARALDADPRLVAPDMKVRGDEPSATRVAELARRVAPRRLDAEMPAQLRE